MEKLRERSPISSCELEPAISFFTRPCESIACSASSRSRASLSDRREANTSSATAPSTKTTSVTATTFSSVRLESERMALVVSSTTTAPATSSPDQMGWAADRMTARASLELRQRRPAIPCSAERTSPAPLITRLGKRVVEVLGRTLEQHRGHRPQRAREDIERVLGARRRYRPFAQVARDDEQALLAVDDPDAQVCTSQALQDALHLAARRHARAQLEELGPVVQRGRHSARGRDKGLLLPFAQHGFHFLDVAVAEPGNRRQHQRHQRHLGSQAKAHFQAFQR